MSLTMASSAICVSLGGETTKASKVLQALGAFFLWMRLQRVLLVFSRFGPYAFMVFVMMEDVLAYLVVLVVFPFAFAAMVSVLLEPPSSKLRGFNLEWLPIETMRGTLGREPDCSFHFESFPNAIKFLFEQARLPSPALAGLP